MTDYNSATPHHHLPAPETASRRPWQRPAVSKMRAGDAEIGPNPDNADGAFTFS